MRRKPGAPGPEGESSGEETDTLLRELRSGPSLPRPHMPRYRVGSRVPPRPEEAEG